MEARMKVKGEGCYYHLYKPHRLHQRRTPFLRRGQRIRLQIASISLRLLFDRGHLCRLDGQSFSPRSLRSGPRRIAVARGHRQSPQRLLQSNEKDLQIRSANPDHQSRKQNAMSRNQPKNDRYQPVYVGLPTTILLRI